MTRSLIAAALVAAFSSVAAAQPAPPARTIPPPPPAVGLPPVVVQIPFDTPPVGPAIPFHKSGGLVVGMYGLYPYDTGNWLLGGTAGLTRQSGAWTMVYPDVFVDPTTTKHSFGKRGFFCK